MKIQTQFLVIIFSLILIVGLNVFIVSEAVSKNSAEKQIYNQLESTAQSRANHIETFLELKKTTVRQLSQSIAIQKLLLTDKNDEDYAKSFNDVTKRLKSRVETGKYTYGVFVLDKSGIVIASNEAGDVGKDKSNDCCFSSGKQGVFVRDAFTSETEGIDSLAFSAPILDDNDEFLGVVIMKVSVEALNEITADTTGLGETGEIYLVNKDGYMITPSRFVTDTFLKQKVDTENTRNCFEDAEHYGAQKHTHAAVLSKDYRGTDVLGVHAYIPEMEWCLLAEMSEEEAFAPLDKLTQTILSLIALLSAVGMILSILISRTITNPIVKLHHGAEEIMRGNLDYKVGTKARDEIGQLSRAFDSMTANLKKFRDELEEYSKGLEKKVEERTAELDERVKESERQKIAIANIAHDLDETNENLEFEIAERKRVEKTLRVAYKELEELDKMKMDFLNVACHELRSPLSPIVGYVSLLEQSVVTEKQKDYIRVIAESASQLDELINSLFEVTRLEAGKIKLTLEPVSIPETVNDVLERVKPQVDAKKQTISTVVPEWIEVEGDKQRITAIFDNLISNAIKYTDKKGRIDIVVEDGKEDIRVCVADTGVGIPEEHLSRIFERFYTVDTPSTRKGSLGLGLTIVKGYVKQHGGKVWATSELGKGSQFFFSLPKRQG